MQNTHDLLIGTLSIGIPSLKINLSVIATTGIKFKSAFLVLDEYWATDNFLVFGQVGKSYRSG